MIPVFEPSIGEEELNAVTEAIKRGELSGSFGKTISDFESKFAEYCGCQFGVACTSGTTALHMAVSAAGISPGDEVLVSASTNIASALAPYHHQAVTVPVDSEAETWNMNINLIDKLISNRTRAIIPVHLYGHPVDMDNLMAIAQKKNLIVIEDCAESHGATVRGRKTGSFGHMACFSFYVNKIITTGEGGMVITNEKNLADKLRLLRNLAFGKPRFFHTIPAYNFRLTGYQAAMGLAQLGKIQTILHNKRRVAQLYYQHLKDIQGLQLPIEKDWALNVYWMYAVVVKKDFGINRDVLMDRLFQSGVETRTFFCPMNQQPFIKNQAGYRDVPCPVADRLWQEGLYLPSSGHLQEDQIKFIADCIKKVREGQ